MFHTRVVWGLLLGTALIAPASGQDDSDPKGAELKGFMVASQAVNAFVKAMRNEDLDALMKVVEVPWFQDGKKIIKSKDELRGMFRGPLEEKDFSELQAEVLAVQQFRTLREKATGTTGELLKQVAQDEDLVFQLTVKLGSQTDGLMLLVRVSEEGAKIIGLRD